MPSRERLVVVRSRGGRWRRVRCRSVASPASSWVPRQSSGSSLPPRRRPGSGTRSTHTAYLAPGMDRGRLRRVFSPGAGDGLCARGFRQSSQRSTASAASLGSGAVRALSPFPWSTRSEPPARSRSFGKSASASEMRSPERKSTAKRARLRIPVGARREQAARRLPLLVANALVMSYIATNHFLNSLTEVNDPLANTLSVTAPRWLEWLHLDFGYHVEHHLFPTMSGRHARTVRAAIVRLYGDRYLTMPHAQALRLLYTRPKLHATHDTLVNPRTGATYHTIAPGDLGMAPLGVP